MDKLSFSQFFARLFAAATGISPTGPPAPGLLLVWRRRDPSSGGFRWGLALYGDIIIMEESPQKPQLPGGPRVTTPSGPTR